MSTMFSNTRRCGNFLRLLIWLLLLAIYPGSAFGAETCATKEGFFDSRFGHLQHDEASPGVKGIGGTGLTEDKGEKGVGGTGLRGDDDEKGIGGTGRLPLADSNLIYVRGTIYAFGSICVNGIEIEYSDTTPVTSDSKKSIRASSLKVGQVVDVLAEKSTGKALPRARNIAVRFPVRGKITDIHPRRNLISVNGKPVRVSNPKVSRSLQLGDSVRVSGLRNARGQTVATFIEKTPDLETAGKSPSLAESIPPNVRNVSVEGYVQGKTYEGKIVIDGKIFDLGPRGKKIDVGARLIVSGKRRLNGVIKASNWSRQRFVPETRFRIRKPDDSDRRNRNRGRGRGRGRSRDDIQEDNSGKGRQARPDDNSGKGSREDSRKEEKVFRPDKSGQRERLDRIERLDKSGRRERLDRIERLDNSGPRERIRIDRPDRIRHPDRPDRIRRPERPERPDRSGRGGGDD